MFSIFYCNLVSFPSSFLFHIFEGCGVEGTDFPLTLFIFMKLRPSSQIYEWFWIQNFLRHMTVPSELYSLGVITEAMYKAQELDLEGHLRAALTRSIVSPQPMSAVVPHAATRRPSRETSLYCCQTSWFNTSGHRQSDTQMWTDRQTDRPKERDRKRQRGGVQLYLQSLQTQMNSQPREYVRWSWI